MCGFVELRVILASFAPPTGSFSWFSFSQNEFFKMRQSSLQHYPQNIGFLPPGGNLPPGWEPLSYRDASLPWNHMEPCFRLVRKLVSEGRPTSMFALLAGGGSRESA